ncbi:MAG: AAA family ATPase [Planctomycetota bacterium]
MRVNLHLPAKAMRERMCRAHKMGERREYEVACYLSVLEERHFYRTFGFTSITQLAENDLGLSPRQTRDRIRLAKAIESLPKLKKLFRRGKLHFSAVRAIVSVATPATESDWIKAALQHSMRDLERLVSASENGKVPKRPNLGLPRNRVHYKLAAEPEEAALIDTVCQREADAKGEPADLMRLVMKVIRHLYQTEDPEIARRKPRNPRPELIFIQARGTQDIAVLTTGGFVATNPEKAAPYLEGARVRDASEPGAMVEGLVSTPDVPTIPADKRDPPTDRALRELVLARDGYQCTFPGCDEKKDLADHHVQWLSQGGKTHPDNGTSACRGHHAATHVGQIVVKGSYSKGFEFEERDLLTGETKPFLAAAPDPEIEQVLSEPSPPEETVEELEKLADPVEQDKGPVLASLDEIPPQVDRKWWRTFRGLFEWVARTTTLLFKPGPGQEPKATVDHAGNGERREGGLAGLVGHEQAVRVLEHEVEMAKLSGEPAPPVLVTGRPGLGKTTLAAAFATDLGRGFHAAHAGSLLDPTAVLSLLSDLDRGDVLFIDEVHALPPAVAELMYTAIESAYVDIPVKEGTSSRLLRLRLEPFTFMGATTEEDRLPKPLLQRFRTRIELEPLADDVMATLLAREAGHQGLALDEEARRVLVSASLGNPRTAVGLIEHAAKTANAHRLERIGPAEVCAALDSRGIDGRGLCKVQCRILEVLRAHGRPMGLATLAAVVGKSPEAVATLYEPDLLQLGLLSRTPLGRVAVPVNGNGRHSRHGPAAARGAEDHRGDSRVSPGARESQGPRESPGSPQLPEGPDTG